MPRHHSTTTLSKIIDALKAEWHRLASRLAEIEATFSEHGIEHKPSKAPGRRPGRPKTATAPKGKPGRRRKRQAFNETAEVFVLGLLNGKKLTTAEINAAWKASGRAGVSNNSLTKLVQAKKIKRHSVKGQKGGTYSVA